MNLYIRISRASLLFSLILASSFLIFQSLSAQEFIEPPMPVEVLFSASGAPAGGEITFAAIFKTPPDHHLTDASYGLWYIEAAFPEWVTVVDTVYPEGRQYKGETIYRGDSPILMPLKIAKDAVPGTYTVPYNYSYQICREQEPETCFLPKGGSGEAELVILPEGSTAIPSSNLLFQTGGTLDNPEQPKQINAENKLEDKLSHALEGKSFAAFLLVFLAGILVSFTPCVYPMIPIIIGFVGGGAGGSRSKGFLLSIFFVIGLAIMYATLGVIAGATGALFGAFMQNPIVLWVIVVVFVVLGASMLGAFDITLPSSVQGKLMSGQRQGFIGAVIMGAVTGIIAAPCAGPPLLVLLGWIGNTGNLVLGFFLMAVFALGIGILFIVIGTFAGVMTALPQAGAWMDSIKKGLGALIFVVAVYYIGLLIPKAIHHVIIGGFLLFVGLFLGAFASWDTLPTGRKYGKGFGILLVLTGMFYFLVGLAAVQGINFSSRASPGKSATEVVLEEKHVPWRVNQYDTMIAESKTSGRPLLIDFYADWCGVCVELDHKVWNDAAVIVAAERYLPLKLDFTRLNSELEALRKKYNVGGLPIVLILGSDGEERSRFSSFKTAEEVVIWLNTYNSGKKDDSSR